MWLSESKVQMLVFLEFKWCSVRPFALFNEIITYKKKKKKKNGVQCSCSCSAIFQALLPDKKNSPSH
jgi:hypothetical protein